MGEATRRLSLGPLLANRVIVEYSSLVFTEIALNNCRGKKPVQNTLSISLRSDPIS